MNKVFAISTVLLIASSCSTGSKPEVGAGNTNAMSPVPRQPVSVEEMQARKEAMLLAIEREAQWARLPNLRDVVLKAGDSEFRLWADFTKYRLCFMFTQRSGQKRATLVRGTITKPARGQKPQVIPVRQSLPEPRSGWAGFERFLEEQGVSYPLAVSLDPNHLSDPDESMIAIEVKSGSAYEMVFFPLVTKAVDGVRALEVCRKIEREFEIELGCHID